MVRPGRNSRYRSHDFIHRIQCRTQNMMRAVVALGRATP